MSQRVADQLARLALRVPAIERVLLAGTRTPLLRRHLRLDAIALGYSRILARRELRIAQMDGYRFYVNLGEPLGVAPYFFKAPGIVWLTHKLIGPGDVCVDAGANAGHYTFWCASVVGPRGRVFAFEPNPEFADMVRRSIDLNDFGGFVRVEQRALYSATGETKQFFLSVNPMNTGTSSLVDHGSYLSPDRVIEVQTISFDDFARNEGVERFRLVKVDVERAEEFVFAGASKTLAEHKIDFIIVEMHAASRSQEILQRAGYRGFFLDAGARRLEPVDEVPHDQFGDFIFVRPGLQIP
jgi:FkbM family methyltransferase